jgi:hypothetical protein
VAAVTPATFADGQNLPSAQPSAKENFADGPPLPRTFLCRVPLGLALGKAAVSGSAVVHTSVAVCLSGLTFEAESVPTG